MWTRHANKTHTLDTVRGKAIVKNLGPRVNGRGKRQPSWQMTVTITQEWIQSLPYTPSTFGLLLGLGCCDFHANRISHDLEIIDCHSTLRQAKSDSSNLFAR